MKQSNKNLVLLASLVTLGGICITAVVEYLYTSTKKKNRLIERSLSKGPSAPCKRRSTIITDKVKAYGALKVENIKDDPVLMELQKMSSLVNQIERVNNLIIDLNLEDVKMHPNPIIAHKTKLSRDDPFLSPDALTEPLSFALHTPEVKSAQMTFFTKKWLRAGPRATVYFHPTSVKAAVVSMGGMVPGVNTVIKELVYVLRQYYQVKEVKGFKYSFETNRRETIDLSIDRVKTLHHYGGSILGASRTDVSHEEITDRLESAGINQLYIIGGPGTLKMANELYYEIKNRKLNIAFCVIPKELTNSIPITERSLGYETALEESEKMVTAGYTESHTHDNGVAIIKIPGKKAGFLTVDTALATRNMQACLVPEFPFELYGEKGLLKFIHDKLRTRSNCTILVAEGCNETVLDYDSEIIGHDWDGSPVKEDISKVIKQELKKYLTERGVKTTVKTIDTYEIRASPSNALETRICCRYAAESIHGLMCGYTNFMIGTITGKTVMIPLEEVNSQNYADRLLEGSSQWARLLMMTCQPSFLNDRE